MRFHVLGLGPIGSLFAHHLRKVLPQAHTVSLIHRTQRQSKLSATTGAITVEHDGVLMSQSGFQFDYFKTHTPHHVVHAEGRILQLPSGEASPRDAQVAGKEDPQPIESLFISTKAHQTVPAVKRLQSRILPSTTIVLLQNGMGVYEQMVHELFPNPLLRPHFILASNTHGAWLKNRTPPHVVHAGIGRISFGIVPDPHGRNFESGLLAGSERKLRLSDIANPPHDEDYSRYLHLRNTVSALLAMEAVNTEWHSISSMQEEIRRKLVVNSIVNPLTALMQCRNGELFRTRSAKKLAMRICIESSRAFAAQLAAEAKAASPDSPSDDVEGWKRLPHGLRPKQLYETCLAVASGTQDNISSMLADLLRGTPSSEIAYMNGYLLKLGALYSVPMPATATLRDMVFMRWRIPIDQQFR